MELTEAKKIAEERKREKMEDRIARQKVKEEIARDRAEREAQVPEMVQPSPLKYMATETTRSIKKHNTCRLQVRVHVASITLLYRNCLSR